MADMGQSCDRYSIPLFTVDLQFMLMQFDQG